jgi:hypothetical protein
MLSRIWCMLIHPVRIVTLAKYEIESDSGEIHHLAVGVMRKHCQYIHRYSVRPMSGASLLPAGYSVLLYPQLPCGA